MKWLNRSILALVALFAVYAASPYVALARLAGTVQARDVNALRERVNLRALRISLAKQLVGGYLTATGRAAELKGPGGQVATSIGATIADPLIAEILTPEALMALLDKGEVPGGAQAGTSAGGGLPRFRDLRILWRLFAESEGRGFRRTYFALPPGRPADQQVKLEMRLNSSLAWRVTGLELPAPVRQRLIQELVRRSSVAMSN